MTRVTRVRRHRTRKGIRRGHWRRQRLLSKDAKFQNLMDRYDSLVKFEANRRNRQHGEQEEFPEITDGEKKQRAAARAVSQAIARHVRLSVPPPWKAKDYTDYLADVAALEDRGPYALPPPRRFVAVPKPPPPKLPWYGLKVTVRKRRRWKPGQRRMRVSADVLDERITKALEAGATLDDVQPLIAEQADKDEYRFSLRGPRGPRHAR